MALVYKTLGGAKTDWIVLSFRAIAAGNPELQQAQQAAQMILPGDAYRFEVCRTSPSFIPDQQFRKRRIKIKGSVALFADPQNFRVLSREAGGTWKGRKIAKI